MHTPEQRDRHALCGARKKNGEQCRLFAGQGTQHPGVGRCKHHLGNTKGHQKNAVKVQAEREMLAAQERLEFGGQIDIEPVEALLTVLRLSAGHLAWLRSELGAHEDKTDFRGQVLMRLWNDERERVARIAKAALDAGVQERQIALAERYGEMLAELLREIFFDPGLALTMKQRAKLPSVLRRHLVPSDAAEADALGLRLPERSATA